MIFKASNGIELPVEIIRKPNKNIYFRVKEDLKLYITCPIYLSSNSILKLASENEDAIIKMYDRVLEKNKDNDLFLYLGNKYYVEVDENVEKIEFRDNKVITPSKKALEYFYNTEVEKIFKEEVEFAKKCFVDLPEFTLKFRKMSTRWGVCNRSKNIVTLNTELLKKEVTLLDYVIIHELCHFYEGNHSKNFWYLVSLAYPNYKEARKKLRS